MTTQDYGPLRDDYAFFEDHATEAQEDARVYRPHLTDLEGGSEPVRLLDFGCGTGRFLARLLDSPDVASRRWMLSLVEPDDGSRRAAVERLAMRTGHPVSASATLADLGAPAGPFDRIVSNHSLYYVPDLAETVRALLRSLRPSGRLLMAMAGEENELVGIWKTAFSGIDRPVPYHVAEDLERVLEGLGVTATRKTVEYVLEFRDAPSNRLRILRFLLGSHLESVRREPLLARFDPHVEGDRVRMRIRHRHFHVEGGGGSPQEMTPR